MKKHLIFVFAFLFVLSGCASGDAVPPVSGKCNQAAERAEKEPARRLIPAADQWEDPCVKFILSAALLRDDYAVFCSGHSDTAGTMAYSDGHFYAHAFLWDDYMAANNLALSDSLLSQVRSVTLWLSSSDAAVAEIDCYDPALSGNVAICPETRIHSLADFRRLPNLMRLDAPFHTAVHQFDPLAGLQKLESLSVGLGYEFYLESLADLPALRQLSLRSEWNPMGDQHLSEIGKISNLERLGLSHINVANLDPLSGLQSLKSLSISSGHVADWSGLKKLARLETLSLSAAMSDLNPLAALSDLPLLRLLELRENHITDVSPLAGLDNLKALDLAYNDITDISPLASLIERLTDLNVSYNQIKNLSPIGRFARDPLNVAGNPGFDS